MRSYVQFLLEETIAFGEVSLFFTGEHDGLRSGRRIDVNQGTHRAPARVKSIHSFWE